MVMPRATAASRASVTGRPWLLGPSPDTSMTRRIPSNPLRSNRPAAKSMAEEIGAAHPVRPRLGETIGEASAASLPSISVHGRTTCCEVSPAHSDIGDRDAPCMPSVIACWSSGERKAAT